MPERDLYIQRELLLERLVARDASVLRLTSSETRRTMAHLKDTIKMTLLFAVLGVMAELGELRSHYLDSRSIRACGSDLADVIGFVCRYNYAGSSKRDINGVLLMETLRLGTLGDQFHERQAAHNANEVNYAKRNKIAARGIVDECCRRQCTIETIQSYCGGPPEGDNDISRRSLLALLLPKIKPQ